MGHPLAESGLIITSMSSNRRSHRSCSGAAGD